jgi:hypothetical protein
MVSPTMLSGRVSRFWVSEEVGRTEANITAVVRVRLITDLFTTHLLGVFDVEG